MPLLLFFVPYFNFLVCFLSLLFSLFAFFLIAFSLLVFCSSVKPLLNPRTIRGFSYTKNKGLLPEGNKPLYDELLCYTQLITCGDSGYSPWPPRALRWERGKASRKHNPGDVVAELDRRRIAAVLAADAAVHGRARRFALLHSHIHQFALRRPCRDEQTDRIRRSCSRSTQQEFTGIVAREAEGHLRQIVRAEAEELRLFRHLVGGERRARDLDHRADFVLQSLLLSAISLSAASTTIFLTNASSFTSPGERDHDLGTMFQSGCFFLTLMAALMTADVCMRAISGYVTVRRQPR